MQFKMYTFILPVILRKNTDQKKKKSARLTSTIYYQHVSFDFCKNQMSLGGTKLVIVIKTDNDESTSDYLVRALG